MKTRKLAPFSRTSWSLPLSVLGALSVWFAPASFQAVSAATLAGESDSTAPPAPAAAPALHYSAGVDEILKMVDAKVDAEVIAAYVRNSSVAYNPSASEIIALRARGVSNEVIVAMIQRGGELRARAGQGNMQYPPPSATGPYAPGPTYQYPPSTEQQPANPGYTYVTPSYQSYAYPTYSYAYPYYSYGYPNYPYYGYSYAYGYPYGYYGTSFAFSFGFPFYGYCGYPYRYGCGSYGYRGYCGYPYNYGYRYPYSSAYHYPYNNGRYYYGGSSAVHNGTWSAQSAAFHGGSSAVRFGSAGHPTSFSGGGGSMQRSTFGSVRAASMGGGGFRGGGGGGGFHGGGGHR